MHPRGTPVGAPGEGWPSYDYVSPGLEVVRPDAAFPRMRAGDHLHHPWKYLRRDVPHTWYVDDRFPLMGFLNRDEAVLLHNIARRFAGRDALEIGSWLGWSTCHLALAGVAVDAIDPAHDDPEIRAVVEATLAACGVADRVHLAGGRSPDAVARLASGRGRPWSLFFVDGDHERPGPADDALACLPHAAEDCAFVFHDLASPAVAEGLRVLMAEGFHVLLYQTAQIMGVAWRGDVFPPAHVPDPDVAWQIPLHLADLPMSGPDHGARRSTTALREPVPGAWPDLGSLLEGTPVSDRQPSVCVVTNEILGLHKNGGIGTSMTGLAETLAAAGMRVTVLYTRTVWEPEATVRPWRARYDALGIELVTLPLEDVAGVRGPAHDYDLGAPFLVHRYLSTHPFDVVHFNDCMGEGSLALAAKRLGAAFGTSLFVTALHSPTQWILEHNRLAPTTLAYAAFDYAERISVRCTDLLWSPSRYLLDWARARDFTPPAASFVQQYTLPATDVPSRTGRPGRSSPPREIVFFGRLEERKGLVLFCDAVDRLADELASRDVTVTFLGKQQTCLGMPALDYVARRSATWPLRVRTLTELDQPQALRYLMERNRLAVMPSPVDNSPCTVYEALALGIPFLAARAGGIPELVHEDDRDDVLFDYGTAALRHALLGALRDGGVVARPAVPQEETRRVLVGLHERWEALRGPVPPSPAPSQWAAAVVDHAPGADLGATLDSIATCPWFRRILVLDRAGDRLPAGVRGLDVLSVDAASFERELSLLGGDSLLLVHSGVSVRPEPLAGMLGVLERAAIDGLVPAGEQVDGEGRTWAVPPLGGSPACSFYVGVTFTGGLLVRRRALAEALRRHRLAPESPFLGLADFCVAAGQDVWPYPDVVFQQPAGGRVAVRTDARARLAAYAGAPEVDRSFILGAAYRAYHGMGYWTPRREQALALVELGLTPLVKAASVAVRSARRVRARAGATAAGARVRRLRRR